MLEDIASTLDQHGARERMKETLMEAMRVRQDLGNPPLVAPVRQMIAAQSVFNVLGNERYATVTQELKDYLQGLYGRPPQPADAEVRRLVLGSDEPITIRPADLLDPQLPAAREQLKKLGLDTSDDAVLSYVLFPSTTLKFLRGELRREPPAGAGADQPANVDGATSEAAPAEPAPAAEPAAAPAATTAEFQVDVEGEVFTVRVTGAGMSVSAMPAGGGGGGGTAPAARPPAQGVVNAPMQGLIVKIPVKKGDEVKLGEVVAVLEAMKMQNDIVSATAGKVQEIYVKEGDVVSPNQAILAIA
jgi:pyruvate carboxylase subunit B